MSLPKPVQYVLSAFLKVWMVLITFVMGSLAVILGWCGLRDRQLRWIPRFWSHLFMAGAFCPVRVVGMEHIDASQPYVFASNHSSALDIPVLQKVLPINIRWMAKKELFSVPVFGRAITALGDIPVDRGHGREAMKSLQEAAQRIQEGAGVVIFPEGTRTPGREMLPFKSGTFLLAIKAQRPIVPIWVEGSGAALPPKSSLLAPQTIVVHMGRPIPTLGLKSADRDQLSETVRQAIEELSAHAGSAA